MTVTKSNNPNLCIDHSNHSRKQKGFSLIELMIAIGVLSILAALGYSSYDKSVQKSNRRAAQADMQNLAQSLERGFILADAYSDLLSENKFTVNKNVQERYAFSMITDGTSYTITASPKGKQGGDPCGTLTLNERGATTPTQGSCWE